LVKSSRRWRIDRVSIPKQVAKPYFREWSNLRFAEGKTFVSNPRLFKADRATSPGFCSGPVNVATWLSAHTLENRFTTEMLPRSKPYFREWSNLRFAEGKTFVSNPRLFKADRALYFLYPEV
jgi:hypothetical protein